MAPGAWDMVRWGTAGLAVLLAATPAWADVCWVRTGSPSCSQVVLTELATAGTRDSYGAAGFLVLLRGGLLWRVDTRLWAGGTVAMVASENHAWAVVAARGRIRLPGALFVDGALGLSPPQKHGAWDVDLGVHAEIVAGYRDWLAVTAGVRAAREHPPDWLGPPGTYAPREYHDEIEAFFGLQIGSAAALGVAGLTFGLAALDEASR